MLPLSIRLLDYADSSGALAQAAQAQILVAALCEQRRNWIELDFTGVVGVGAEFSDEFLRLAGRGLAQTWLLPRNDTPACGHLTYRLLSRLKLQRDQAWIDGCAAFCGNTPP